MKLEEQVCSLELSKRLKELGVKQEDALYAWIKCKPKSEVRFNEQPFSWPTTEFFVTTNVKEWSWADWQCAAFSVAELGEMLPYYFLSFCYYGEWTCKQLDHERIIKLEPETFADSEANCRAKMLVYLIEQVIIKPFQGEIER